MKPIFTFLLLLLANSVFAQSGFPTFLQGTWKMENKESYEHWDLLNDNSLKGFSYKMDDGELRVSEYMDIAQRGNETVFTAHVLDQNRGKGIDFRLVKSDTAFVFENPAHDFPKKITYQKLSGTEILVRVSGGNDKGFSYKMHKQNRKTPQKDSTVSNPNYDAALAKKLGADEYGMKKFVFVVLKTGPNKTTDKTFIGNTFKGHLANINRLVEQKKLIVAGPFGKNQNHYRGLFIFDNVGTLEEAKALLQTDPSIKAGLLDFEIYDWYGSAALAEYLKTADKIWKINP